MTADTQHASRPSLRQARRRPDVLLAVVVVVLWFACGLAHVVGTRAGAPPGIVGLLAPSTPATGLVREPVRGLPSAALTAAVLVGVFLLAARTPLRASRVRVAPRALAVWFAVVVAGVAASAVHTLTSPYTTQPGGLRHALLSGALEGLRHAGAWGVTYGGLVALVAARLLRGADGADGVPGGADRQAASGAPRAAVASVAAGVLSGSGWTVLALLHSAVDTAVTRNVTTPRSEPAAALRAATDWLLPVSSATDVALWAVLLSGLLVAVVTSGLTWLALRDGVPRDARAVGIRAVWLACVVGAALGALPTVVAPDRLDPEGGGSWQRAQDALLGPTDGGAAGLLLGWIAALVALTLLRPARPEGAAAAALATPVTASTSVTPQPEAPTVPQRLRDPRVLVPVLSVAAWLVTGLLHTAGLHAGLPAGLLGLVAPATSVVRPGGVPGSLVAVATLAAVALAVARPALRAREAGRVTRALGVWFAVVVAGVAAVVVRELVDTALMGGAWTSPDFWYLSVAMDRFAPIRSAAAWGVSCGWVVALVVARVAWHRGSAPEPAARHTAWPPRTALPAAVVAGVLGGAGWALAATLRGMAMDAVAEHAAVHPELAWRVHVAVTWLLPVGSADDDGPAAVALAAVLVGVLVGALTWWGTARRQAAAESAATGRALTVQVVWLACVVGATVGALPTAARGDAAVPQAIWSEALVRLGPTQGGAVGLLYGWLVGLAVLATLSLAARRPTGPTEPLPEGAALR